MTAAAIQSAIFEKFGHQSLLVVPNYTPHRWFECDVLRVTKAGYAEEFEIKLSVADFKADAKKGPDEREKAFRATWRPEEFDGRTKHERLAAGDPFGPSRFWFAVPDTLAGKIEIPAWAGLMVFRSYGTRALGSVAIKAPRLHRSFCPTKVTDHARTVFYWRYWNLKRGQKEGAA